MLLKGEPGAGSVVPILIWSFGLALTSQVWLCQPEMQKKGLILQFHLSTSPGFDNHSEIWGRMNKLIKQCGKADAETGRGATRWWKGALL